MMPRHPHARARGAAIIIAMIVAALAATVTIAIAAEQQRWLAGVAARRDQVQAQSLALAAVQWTRQILLEDGARGSVDYLGEPWALPLPPTPLENGSIEGRIVDAQGLMNVNDLAQTGAQGDNERARFARLFARAGLGQPALEALADWVGTDPQARPQGALDAWYARQATPYLAAHAPMLRIGELAAVRGFDDAALARVMPYLAALPETTAVNVNTAPAAVLAALLQVPETNLTGLVAERVTRPFASIADFRNRLPQGAVIDDERAFAVASSYFLVTVRARQGDTIAQARALLKRSQGAWPVVVWQTIE
jgi:general secretion pathway protein K